MRPNIDVPWSTHGEVREYGDARDLSIEDAYLKLISESLENSSPPEPETSIDLTPTISSDKSRLWSGTNLPFLHSNGENGPVHIFPRTPNQNILKWLYFTSQPVCVAGTGNPTDFSGIRKMLEKLAVYMHKEGQYGSFSIRGGIRETLWVGRGLQTFLEALDFSEKRYEKRSLTSESPSDERSLFIAPLSGTTPTMHHTKAEKHLIITTSTGVYNESIFPWAKVGVVMNGYPVSQSGLWSTPLQKTGGMHDTMNEFPIDTLSASVDFEPEIVQSYVGGTLDVSNETVKFKIKNPWYDDVDGVRDLFDRPNLSSYRLPLWTYEHLFVTPDAGIREPSDLQYKVTDIDVHLFERTGAHHAYVDISLHAE